MLCLGGHRGRGANTVSTPIRVPRARGGAKLGAKVLEAGPSSCGGVGGPFGGGITRSAGGRAQFATHLVRRPSPRASAPHPSERRRPLLHPISPASIPLPQPCSRPHQGGSIGLTAVPRVLTASSRGLCCSAPRPSSSSSRRRAGEGGDGPRRGGGWPAWGRRRRLCVRQINPLLRRRVADEITARSVVRARILAFAQEEPVAGVDDAGVLVAGAGAHLSIVGAQLRVSRAEIARK